MKKQSLRVLCPIQAKKDVLISRFIVHNKTPITRPPNHKEKHTIVWVINKPFDLDQWINNYEALSQSRLLSPQQSFILAYDGDLPFQEQTSPIPFLNNKGHNVKSLCLNATDANEQCYQTALTHLVTKLFPLNIHRKSKKTILKTCQTPKNINFG